LIDKALVTTDRNGYFELRENHKRNHRITVDIGQSTTQLNYEIISAPSHIESREDSSPGVTVVVKPTNTRGATQMFNEHQQIEGQARNSRPASPPAPGTKPTAAYRLAPKPAAVGTTTTSAETYRPYVPYKPSATSTTSDRAVVTSGQE